MLTDLQIQVILNQNSNCLKISNLTNKAKIYMEMQKAKNSQDTWERRTKWENLLKKYYTDMQFGSYIIHKNRFQYHGYLCEK